MFFLVFVTCRFDSCRKNPEGVLSRMQRNPLSSLCCLMSLCQVYNHSEPFQYFHNVGCAMGVGKESGL